ncbi:MAG: N-acetylmuramic acid 6-phosphate etherase, partial [Terriglobales bacterium]
MSDSEDLRDLTTEDQNPASADLDTKSALEIAHIINLEDAKVAAAVERALPQIARAIDAVGEAIANGGRLIYVGAGTSGRIAALDAAECPPTFDTDPETVQFIMAGGVDALWNPFELAEDSAESGQREMARRKPGPQDVVAGIAASGRTPYTLAAVEYARSKGATTIALTCNPDTPLGRAAEIEIVVEVGPEVLAGSTRMKAGTAQKMICNMITTGAMARAGYVYGNLMVNVHPKNEKLVARAVSILESAAQTDHERAAAALKESGNSVPVALIMLKAGVSKADAQRHLELAAGNVRHAIESAQP